MIKITLALQRLEHNHDNKQNEIDDDINIDDIKQKQKSVQSGKSIDKERKVKKKVNMYWFFMHVSLWLFFKLFYIYNDYLTQSNRRRKKSSMSDDDGDYQEDKDMKWRKSKDNGSWSGLMNPMNNIISEYKQFLLEFHL